jgi:hypothetical protein
MMFDTGTLKWRVFDKWPPATAQDFKFYLRDGKQIAEAAPGVDDKPFSEFVSNPNDPVPYRLREDIRFQFTPREYMSDDQRFAAQRADVLVFQTEPLKADVTLAGELLANLSVSTSQSDADWIVKLIDVFPDNHRFVPGSQPGLDFRGFQLMVRSEVMRGRFRNSYEVPEPFVADKITTVKVPLQDVCHTFKKGHRVMVQIQSTWFPLIDRNPQKWVDNIFKANPEDYVTATHRVFHSPQAQSWIQMRRLPSN